VPVDLTFARAQVAQLATDTCRIDRDAGTADDTFDPSTGTWTSTSPTVPYEGPCWVRDAMSNAADRRVDTGAVEATLQQWIVKVPDLSADVAVGDLVTITDSQDPRLIGRRFVVRDIGGGTYKVARTLTCDAYVHGTDNDWENP
jgi:hypothetical protein